MAVILSLRATLAKRFIRSIINTSGSHFRLQGQDEVDQLTSQGSCLVFGIANWAIGKFEWLAAWRPVSDRVEGRQAAKTVGQ
jgi:hypothetical protein